MFVGKMHFGFKSIILKAYKILKSFKAFKNLILKLGYYFSNIKIPIKKTTQDVKLETTWYI